MDQYLPAEQKQKIFDAACNGADAFNMARLAAIVTEQVSKRTKAVGPKSVSVLLPLRGFLDTDMW